MARWGMATCLAGLGNLPSVVAVGVEPRQGRAYVAGALFPRRRVSTVSGAGVREKWRMWMRDGMDCRDGLFVSGCSAGARRHLRSTCWEMSRAAAIVGRAVAGWGPRL
jgi:hypothetical protein